jgi:hypothetical protein
MNKKIFTLFFPGFYQNIPPVIRTTIPMIDNSGLAYSIIVFNKNQVDDTVEDS